MSPKKRYFLFLNSFLLIILFFIIIFYFTQQFFLSLFLSLIIVGIYIVLSKSLVDEIFTIEKNLQDKIQKSMHELNTPVSTIQINTSILKTKLKEPKNLDRLKRIELASQDLLNLYEDMEYFIKKNIDKVDIQTFFLKEAINKSIEKFEDIKKCQIITDIPQNIKIKTDKKGFITVLDNLIQNAIKHNPNLTTIKIYYKNNNLFVKDDGKGIDSKDICNVFNKYFKDHKAKGFGLGLLIVKEFCDKYGLEIKIASSKKGSTFQINLKKILV